TSSCLLLLLNVAGIYNQMRRAIISATTSILLITVATFLTYASSILITSLSIILVLRLEAFRPAPRVKRPVRIGHIVAT
ncbi:hypothetical protein, partial [Staphylococcus aureus]